MRPIGVDLGRGRSHPFRTSEVHNNSELLGIFTAASVDVDTKQIEIHLLDLLTY